MRESDTALPCFAVHEEGVKLGNVHHHCVSLVQVNVSLMVLITLVLGEIHKHLRDRKEREEILGFAQTELALQLC